MKSIALASVTLLAASMATGFELYESKFLNVQQDIGMAAWPNISLPHSFRLAGTYYTWNNQTRQLESFNNMSIVELVDSNKNRELVLVNETLPEFGYSHINSHINCTSGILTSQFPAIGYCNQSFIGERYNLSALIDKVNDRHSGLIDYLGTEQLPWTDRPLHHFRLNVNWTANPVVEHLFFCPVKLTLKYLTIEGYDFIMESDKGFTSETFYDSEFFEYQSCFERTTLTSGKNSFKKFPSILGF